VRSYRQYCAVAKALDVVGDRWALLIVRELALRGPCRYIDLQNGLPGIATNLLADRLRELEHAGVIRREEAPAPVARTLFELTDEGAELEPVIRALGRWGARFMPHPADGDQFRSHWLAFPISEYLHAADPDAAPITIELRTGDQPVTIEARDGELITRLGPADSPDLVLSGPPPPLVGLLAGSLTVSGARKRGLKVSGDPGVLSLLQPRREPSARRRSATQSSASSSGSSRTR
jgi:DNA-binding HxlR family transcriptional regulator